MISFIDVIKELPVYIWSTFTILLRSLKMKHFYLPFKNKRPIISKLPIQVAVSS